MKGKISKRLENILRDPAEASKLIDKLANPREYPPEEEFGIWIVVAHYPKWESMGIQGTTAYEYTTRATAERVVEDIRKQGRKAFARYVSGVDGKIYEPY